jgi:hypothetical protein
MSIIQGMEGNVSTNGSNVNEWEHGVSNDTSGREIRKKVNGKI